MAEKKAKKTKEEEKNLDQNFDFDFDESEIAPLKSSSLMTPSSTISWRSRGIPF